MHLFCIGELFGCLCITYSRMINSSDGQNLHENTFKESLMTSSLVIFKARIPLSWVTLNSSLSKVNSPSQMIQPPIRCTEIPSSMMEYPSNQHTPMLSSYLSQLPQQPSFHNWLGSTSRSQWGTSKEHFPFQTSHNFHEGLMIMLNISAPLT